MTNNSKTNRPTEPLIGLVNRVKIANGRTDKGAGDRGLMIARDLYHAGLWNGEGEIWFDYVYDMYPALSTSKITLNDLVITHDLSGTRVSLPDDFDQDYPLPQPANQDNNAPENKAALDEFFEELRSIDWRRTLEAARDEQLEEYDDEPKIAVKFEVYDLSDNQDALEMAKMISEGWKVTQSDFEHGFDDDSRRYYHLLYVVWQRRSSRIPF